MRPVKSKIILRTRFVAIETFKILDNIAPPVLGMVRRV